MDADPRGGRGHIRFAQAARDFHFIEKDAIAVGCGLQADACSFRQPAQFFAVVQIAVGLNGFERKGAVHGTAFQVEQAEAGSDARRHRALAGSGRTIDGDD